MRALSTATLSLTVNGVTHTRTVETRMSLLDLLREDLGLAGSKKDELALAAGLDPIELRVRNEPEVDPESGRPIGSRWVVNAVHHATGVRIRALPVRPDRLLDALARR